MPIGAVGEQAAVSLAGSLHAYLAHSASAARTGVGKALAIYADFTALAVVASAGIHRALAGARA